MRLRVLGAYGAEAPGGRHASAFLVDGSTLIDAGSVTSILGPAEQLAIERVLVSHPHLDHVAGLAYLTEARALSQAPSPLVIASLDPVLRHLQRSFFNGAVWPDFAAIPSAARPVVEYRALDDGVAQAYGPLQVTAVPVTHTIDAAGFILSDGQSGLAYSGDTGPTERLWSELGRHPEVATVLLECSFPNRLAGTADAAKHLTPRTLAAELDKLPRHARVLVFHVKPQFYHETAREIADLGSDRIALVEQGRSYDVS